jgi:hypothetical protein
MKEKSKEEKLNQGWKIVSIGEQRLKLHAEKDDGIHESVIFDKH